MRRPGWRMAILLATAFLAAVLQLAALIPQSASDQAIINDIDAKLFQDPTLKTRDIRVACENGIVTLAGKVRNQGEKKAVENIASYQPGVKQVIDSMSVQGAAAPVREAPAASRISARSGITVPAGAVVTVRMIDSIDSKRNHPGDEFDATVDAPVAVGDRVVIPKDSNARVRLVNATNAGRIKGSADLKLELVSLTVNGVAHNVESGYYEQHGKSRGKRSAEVIGGGAALGAIIGAIAGGRTGTAIGAGAGAAAGTGVQVMTKGEAVRVPSETKLDFTLRSPVIIASR